MIAQESRDEQYRNILIDPIRVCADYLPKMGGSDGIDQKTFVKLYGSDPLYHWMGFDSPLMFSAHKAAGGMTSLYRQLGIGTKPNGKVATRYLDGRLDFDLVQQAGLQKSDTIRSWV